MVSFWSFLGKTIEFLQQIDVQKDVSTMSPYNVSFTNVDYGILNVAHPIILQQLLLS